jgi:predicted nuclease with TOPRIM domain
MIIDKEKLQALCEKLCNAEQHYANPLDFERDLELFESEVRPAKVLALLNEINRLNAVSTMQEAVACVFDSLKMAACNTSGKEWSEELEELAEDVIEYAPEYKRQWKDICVLSSENNRLSAENKALRSIPMQIANEYSQLLMPQTLSRAKAEKFQQRMNAAMEMDTRMKSMGGK